jgi:hypothetical protein
VTTTPHFRNRADRLRTYNEGTIKIDGSVTFFYSENGDTEARVTLNTLDEPMYGEGFALLHPDDKDNYVQSFGEQLALTRAMQDAMADAELFLIEQTREENNEDTDGDNGGVDERCECSICEGEDCDCVPLDGHDEGPREDCAKCNDLSISPGLRNLKEALEQSIAVLRAKQREQAIAEANANLDASRAALREAITNVIDAYKQRANTEAGA